MGFEIGHEIQSEQAVHWTFSVKIPDLTYKVLNLQRAFGPSWRLRSAIFPQKSLSVQPTQIDFRAQIRSTVSTAA